MLIPASCIAGNAIMVKQPHQATLLYFPPPPARTGLSGRLHAAFVTLKAFFCGSAVPQGSEAPAPRTAGAARDFSVIQRKHLRLVHTGTRI